MSRGPWKQRWDAWKNRPRSGEEWGDGLMSVGVTASVTALVMLTIVGLGRPSVPSTNAMPSPPPLAMATHGLAPWSFASPDVPPAPTTLGRTAPDDRPLSDEDLVRINPEAGASVTGAHLGDSIGERWTRDHQAMPGDRDAPGRRTTDRLDSPPPVLVSDPDRAGAGISLTSRFAGERNPMERMQGEVACTETCTVQAVVAPKAYMTVHLNALDHLGQVSLDDPQGWAVKGYYDNGVVPTLRVEDTGTLNGHPPHATWLRVKTTGWTVNVRLTPEAPGLIALPGVQVNDGSADQGANGWFKTSMGGAGL